MNKCRITEKKIYNKTNVVRYNKFCFYYVFFLFNNNELAVKKNNGHSDDFVN